jgi:mannose-6-phosphate isomerase-like protein (cupin superfamily)
MAKIGHGNWNELPWRPIPSKFVDGDCKTYTIAIGMECENMIAAIGKRYNGAPVSSHTHYYEQVVIVLQGEADLYVDGIPYRLSAGSWINVPPHYEHYSHVYRTKVPVIEIEATAPYRESTKTQYLAFLKQMGVNWERNHVREVPDLIAPQDSNLEVRG